MPENSVPSEDPSRQPPGTDHTLHTGSASADPPPGTRKQLSISVVLSCLLILAIIITSQMSRNRQLLSAGHASTPDVTLQLTGRYTIGMKSILGSALVVDRSLPQLKEILETSDNPRKHLFFIPILMELSGDEENLAELERLVEESANDPIAGEASIFLKLYQQGSDSLSQEQIDFIEQYGWIGKLALSHDKSDSDPLRSEVLQSAIKTFIVSIVFIVVVLAALATGLILFIIAVVLWKKKRLRPRLTMPNTPGDSLLESFALFLGGLIALPALARWVSPNLETAASFFTFPIIVLALLWPSIRGSSFKDVRKAMGLHRGEGVFREMGAGIVGYLAGLPLLGLALIPVLILSRSAGSVPSHPIVNEIRNDPVSLVLIMGLACLWAPVVEETFFRGTLFGYLRRRWHWSVAGIVSGLLFAVMHPQGWIAVPLLGTIGFTLSTIREWRGSIIASMTAHALNNGAVLLLTIFMLT